MSATNEGTVVGTVGTIFRYPIKSVGGHTVDAADVDATGLVGDRRFAFVDRTTGELCNAKHPRVFGAMLACTARYVSEPRSAAPLPLLEVTFPDGSVARNEGGALDEAMSRFLGRPVVLIESMPEDGLRTKIVYDEASGQDRVPSYASAVADEHGDEFVTYAKRRNAMGTFVDLAPLHLVTTSTLAYFAALEPSANFDVRRYRPTMLLDTASSGGALGLVEDGWVGGAVRIGSSVVAGVTELTPRCIMSTNEHAPGVPLDRATLRAVVRHNAHALGARGRWGCLGVYTDVRAGGVVRVGDDISVISFSPKEPNP